MNRFIQYAFGILIIAAAVWLILDKLVMVSTLPQGTLRDGIETVSREVGPPLRDLASSVISLFLILALAGIGLKWLNKKAG